MALLEIIYSSEVLMPLKLTNGGEDNASGRGEQFQCGSHGPTTSFKG